MIILSWKIKAKIPAGTCDTAGMGCGLYAVSKFGNCTRTCATRFGNTVGITVPVAKPNPYNEWAIQGQQHIGL